MASWCHQYMRFSDSSIGRLHRSESEIERRTTVNSIFLRFCKCEKKRNEENKSLILLTREKNHHYDYYRQ